MSIQKHGLKKVNAIKISSINSHTRERERKYPCVPAVNNNIAMVAIMKIVKPSTMPTPINNRSVL